MQLFKNKSDIIHQLDLDKVPKFSQIRLETTNLCGYNCFCCPRKNMTRPLGTMPIEDLNYVLDVLDYIKYELRFFLHGYGEAFLADDLPERIALVKKRKVNFSTFVISTLGYEKSYEWMDSLFKNGLDEIWVSLYGYDRESYKAAHGADKFDLVMENIQTILDLQKKYGFIFKFQLDDFDKNYPGLDVCAKNELRKKFIEKLRTLGVKNSDIAFQKLHGFADGFKDFPKYHRDLPCSVCWGNRRSHLVISWDLDVVPCSYDYDSTVKWGNLKQNSLEEIFNSTTRMDFIKSSLNMDISNYPICNGCFNNMEGHFDKEMELVRKNTQKVKNEK